MVKCPVEDIGVFKMQEKACVTESQIKTVLQFYTVVLS
jgi:hypothetical protein